MKKSYHVNHNTLNSWTDREHSFLLAPTPLVFPNRVVSPRLNYSWFFDEWLVNREAGYKLLTRLVSKKSDWIAICFTDSEAKRISFDQFDNGEEWQHWVYHSDEWSFVSVTYIYCLSKNIVLYSYFDCPSILSSDEQLTFTDEEAAQIFSVKEFIDECVGNYFVGLDESLAESRARIAIQNYNIR